MTWKWEMMHDAVATIVRPLSATVFLAQIVEMAVTAVPLRWTLWRRYYVGWEVWMNLRLWCAGLACMCLVGCLLLAILQRSCDKGKLKKTGWCVWLNIATILWVLLVPVVVPM